MPLPAPTLPLPKVPFFQTATGHAVIGIAVSAVSSILLSALNDPTLATDLGIGGTAATIVKFVVDLLRPGIVNL